MNTPASYCKFALLPPTQSVSTTPETNDPAGPALPSLTGYAIVYNVVSSDDRNDRIAPGAVTWIKDYPVLALWDHSSRDVIGSTDNGTLRLASDDYGIKVEIDPPAVSYAADLCELVRSRYITGMSFGMTPVKWIDTTENGEVIRTYTKIIVDEVSVVSQPAFLESAIALATDYSAHELKLEELKFRNLFLEA